MMKKTYSIVQLMLLVTLALVAQAQHTFTADALGPYQQTFDKMGTGNVMFDSNGTNANLPGIIIGYINSSGTFSAVPGLTANNGLTGASAAYNFGSTGASDRALGGIAGGTNGASGIGYICVRLRNSSGVMIKNLDIRYAIEQWYNSSNSSDAYFRFSYRKYGNTTSFTNNDIVSDANWTSVSALDQQAPATAGLTGQVDGNSATYRRVAQSRLVGINLADNTEIVLRLKYIFNSNTNGNGISVDDIGVYPETNVLYSTTTGDLSNTSGTWGQNTNGSNQPAAVNFTDPNTTYYVQGTSTAARISNNWQVTGANSRVVVGTDASPATLLLAAGATMTATVDVSNGSTLQIADRLTDTKLNVTLGSLAAGSTVEYVATNTQNVLGGTYSTLTLGGSNSAKFPKGALTVAKTLNLSQAISLQGYNLTLLRGATLNRSSNGQIVTGGSGDFRVTVPGAAGAAMLFPMATSSAAADYLPVTITSGSSDKDETYRVQVINNIYSTYTTSGSTPATATNKAGPTAATAIDNLNATWFIGHETATPVAATLKLAWVANSGLNTREGSRFMTRRAQTFIDHYTTSSNTWDARPANMGAFLDNGLWAVQRTGVSNFSPFAVTTNSAGPLPVRLTAFAASRVGSAVVCTWATASELNSNYFELERSLDGQQFRALGRVAAQVSSTEANSYRWADEQPSSGVAYYRLRQVDIDGTAAYSPVVTVIGTATNSSLVAVPNPSGGSFVLQTAFSAAAQVQATVLNTRGQQVLHVTQALPAGSATLPLDLRAQPAGVYVVRLLGPNGPQTLRLLKQ